MGNDNSFLKNASSFFDKLMKQKYVKKTQLLQLKKQFDQLRKQDFRYNNLYNRITNIANRKAIGKNPLEIIKDEYADFNKLKAETD